MFKILTKKSRLFIACMCFIAILAMTASAAPNWLSELTERYENSPHQASLMIFDILRDGAVSFEVEGVDWHGYDEAVLMRFYSNLQNLDFALTLSVLDRWTDFNLDMLLNRERVAARANYFGDSFLGARFGSLEGDLHTFLADMYALGIFLDMPTAADFEEVLEYVDIINSLPNFDLPSFDLLSFADLLLPFLLSIQQTNQQVVIESGGANVSVQRSATTVDINAVESFLISVIDRVERDYGLDGWMSVLDEIRSDLLRYYGENAGSATAAIYIDATGRMRRVGLEVISEDAWGDENAISMFVDFGANALDTWAIEIFEDSTWSTEHIRIAWEIEHSDLVTHRTIITDTWQNHRWHDTPRVDETIMTMAWDPAIGALAITIEEHGHWGSFSETAYGIFTMSDTGFVLQYVIDDITVTISAEAGVAVPRANFINLDSWATVPGLVALFGTPQVGVVEIIETPAAIELEVAIEPSANTATVANCRYLHLRRGPGASYVAFNHLVVGDVVTVLEVRGGWVQVYTHRGTGWVFGRYLDI